MNQYKLESSTLCESFLGQKIEILRRVPVLGSQNFKVKIILMAAMHGDEPEGVYLMDHFIDQKLYEQIPSEVELFLIPRLNPDGYKNSTRVNGRGVDLNRNFPTSDWNSQARADRYFPGVGPGSEPETQGLMAWLKTHRPDFLINFHSWNPMVNFNGDCRDLAQVMSSINLCPVTDDMGYPTPGSSGTWFWEALSIPSITLEIQEGSTQKDVVEGPHVRALVEVLKAAARKYIDS